MDEKNCLECGEKLQGRSDKKFCSDYCRNAYNNRQNSDEYNLVRRINRILKKNRRILETQNPAGKGATTRSELLRKGFDFNYFTNTFTTQNNRIYFFCYDQGYFMLEKDKVALVKKKEYVG